MPKNHDRSKQDAWRTAKTGISRIARDHTAGSAELTRRATRVVENFLRRSRALDERELARRLERLAYRLLAAQPSMAAVIRLANTMFLATERSGPSLPNRVRRNVARLRAALDAMPRAIAREFARVVPRQASILTYSYSSTVLQALLPAHRAGKKITVICSESRPMLEGRRLARRLAQAGVPVTLVVDALLASLVAEADLVVSGADAVLARGFMNKVGTRVLLEAAHAAPVPFYLLADQVKFLPPSLERWCRPAGREESAREVWPGAPGRVRIVNRYFEFVPWSRWTGARILSDRGAISLRQLRRQLAALPVAKQLDTFRRPPWRR